MKLWNAIQQGQAYLADNPDQSFEILQRDGVGHKFRTWGLMTLTDAQVPILLAAGDGRPIRPITLDPVDFDCDYKVAF